MTDSHLGAVVLTGGTGSRLGGADKAALVVDGVTLLARALAATARAATVVVVGDPSPTPRSVVWAREDPPGGGPAAGLLAGTSRLAPECELVLALAVDMPRVCTATVDRLVRALEGTPLTGAAPYDGAVLDGAMLDGAMLDGAVLDGAVLVDGTGQRQPLCAVYRRAALTAAAPAQPDGLSMRRLVAPLRLLEVPAQGEEAADVDTWEDLGRLRRDRGR